MPAKSNGVQFSALFRPTEVICQTEQTDRDTILLDLLRLLAYQRRGIGNVADAYKAVLDRENDMPTIVAPGMAMPHARLEAIDQIIVGMATSKTDIVYDRNHPDKLIKLIILTLVPKDAEKGRRQKIRNSGGI